MALAASLPLCLGGPNRHLARGKGRRLVLASSSPLDGSSSISLGKVLAPDPQIDGGPPQGAVGKDLELIYERCRAWQWKGYKVNYVALAAPGRPCVLLVHGFGASIGHWRRNFDVLAKDYSVYALDLLGQGASEKPPGFRYTIETWAELVTDFVEEVIGSPSVLIGNSIGSLVCLTVAASAPRELVRGTVLLNCAGGMNNKAVVDDWRIKLLLPLLWLIDWMLKQPSISSRLFDRVRSRENLKKVLSSVYSNKEAVDDELVEIIRRPAEEDGALDAFVEIITGPPGPTPMVLMDQVHCPVLVLWGDRDPFTPIDGPVGRYFVNLPSKLPTVKLVKLEDVGHCPQDDRPELVHQVLLPWLDKLVKNLSWSHEQQQPPFLLLHLFQTSSA